MLNFLICGIAGHMGGNILELLKDDGEARAACGVDVRLPENFAGKVFPSFGEVDENVDAVIDFSSPACLNGELEYCTARKVPAVIAATGYTGEQLKLIERAAQETAVFRTANFSVGVNLLVKLVREAAQFLGESFDIEIVEKHHNLKKDAPSGTALMLADAANSAFEQKKPYIYGREGITGARGREIGLHAVRGGTIVGEHDVMFCGEDEIITLSHSARSKKVFAAGAIRAAKWIAGKPAGMYDMKDLLGNL